MKVLPIPLRNTITAGGYADAWAHGIRAPAVEVGLEGAWQHSANVTAWSMDLPALFPMP